VANANINGDELLARYRAVAELNRSLAGDAIASYSNFVGRGRPITAQVLPEVFHLIRILSLAKQSLAERPGCWRSANERKPSAGYSHRFP